MKMTALYSIALVVACITTRSSAAAVDGILVMEDGQYSSNSHDFAAAADGVVVTDGGSTTNNVTPRRALNKFSKKTTNSVSNEGATTSEPTPSQEMQRCHVTNPASEKACPQVLDPLYCGTQTTADPRVFGPHIWTFLHTVALYYTPHHNASSSSECRKFLNGLTLMIPCPHCARHYNQYLIGTKDTNTSVPARFLWDWKNDGDPCATNKSLQYFFLKKHGSVGQEVNKLSPTRPTRPPFEVQDLVPLYGTKFMNNSFIASDQPKVFIPILVEAINLMFMNYVEAFGGTGKPAQGVPEGSVDFFNSLEYMLPIQFGIDFPSFAFLTIRDAFREGGKRLIWELVEGIEDRYNVPKLNRTDRIRRYNTRHICMHSTIWKNHPMCRSEGQSQCSNPVDANDDANCCIPWMSLDDS